MKLLYQGSVKDLYQLEDSTLVFQYSDRYSIYDWGQMPDLIPGKGHALSQMASLFFEFLQDKNNWLNWQLPNTMKAETYQRVYEKLCKDGLSTHYISTFGNSQNSIRVKAVDVIRPKDQRKGYDYSAYILRPTNCLVPLEVIFRRALGVGNSLTQRLQKDKSYLVELGLDKIPESNDEFVPALVEFSTKLESTDRYLKNSDLHELNICTVTEIELLKITTQIIAERIAELFYTRGIRFWDGKFEYSFLPTASGDRDIQLVDSIGPDELRLTFEGMPLSKEFLRQMYSRSSWAESVKIAKEIASKRGEKDWKQICKIELQQTPTPLSGSQLNCAAELYQVLVNELALAMNKELPNKNTKTLTQWQVQAKQELQKVGAL